MKKYILIISILIGIKLLIPLKPYKELNDIKIINEINITCKNEYRMEYKEIIPKKEDNGIKYTYKTKIIETKELEDGIKQLNKNTYIKQAKITTKNCKNKKEIKDKIKRG